MATSMESMNVRTKETMINSV